MNMTEIRRHNLRTLMAEHSAIKLSKMLGYRQSSFLSQMAGPRPTREITEKTARAYEKQLGLEPGALDTPPAVRQIAQTGVPVSEVLSTPQTGAAQGLSPDELITMVLTATRTVGRICETEAVNLPTSKFAELLVMGLKDAMEHGGHVQEDRIHQVVALLK